MDYKEKYEIALEHAKSLYNSMFVNNDILEQIFPELKENEEERIKKVLVGWFKRYKEENTIGSETFNGISTDSIIAWLEKQCNTEQVFRPLAGCYIEDAARQAVERQKQGKNVVLAFNGCYIPVKIYNTADAIEKEYRNRLEKARREYYNFVRQEATSKIAHSEQKPDDNVEPLFNVGDWVVDNNCGKVKQVSEIQKNGYGFKNGDYSSFESAAKNYRPWTVKDAKDGDILASGGVVFIFKTIHGVKLNCHCSALKDGSFFADSYDLLTEEYFGEVCPATKEQCDLLFQKMNEAGYEWDEEAKELKKIKQDSNWNNEDESQVEFLTALCEDQQINSAGDSTMHRTAEEAKTWLKSIKDRIHPNNIWHSADEEPLVDNAFVFAEWEGPKKGELINDLLHYSHDVKCFYRGNSSLTISKDKIRRWAYVEDLTK